LRHVVLDCSYAATHHEMPGAWRACILKQVYEDMQQVASFMESYWPEALRA